MTTAALTQFTRLDTSPDKTLGSNLDELNVSQHQVDAWHKANEAATSVEVSEADARVLAAGDNYDQHHFVNPRTGNEYTDAEVRDLRQMAVEDADARVLGAGDDYDQHHFVNPGTGSEYTDAEVRDLRQMALEDADARVLAAGDDYDQYHFINPRTGREYTDAEVRAIHANGNADTVASDEGNSWDTSPSGVYTEGGLTYVVLPENAQMQPFVRDDEELFTDTVEDLGDDGVVINGNQFGVSRSGKIDASRGDDPIDPSETTPEGRVINDGDYIAGGDEPERFYVGQAEDGQYVFGQGDPPDDLESAVGGLGPIIVDGVPYGVGNKYSVGVPDGAPEVGEPDDQYAPFLTQRNNNTYAAVDGLPESSGKTIVAYSSEQNKVVIISQMDGADDGASFNDIREELLEKGFDNAVFLDGSDSALLTVDGMVVTEIGQNKDETNTVGVQFVS